MKRNRFLIIVLTAAFIFCGCSAIKETPAPEPTAAPTELPAEGSGEQPTEEPTAAPTEAPTPVPFSAADLAGVWTAREFRFDENVYTAEELGLETYFEFRGDATVYCVRASSDGYDETIMPFDTDGFALTFHDASDVPGVYDPETDTIVMTYDGGTMVLARASDAKVPEQKIADTSIPPVGTWKLTRSVTMGQEISAEAIGQEMYFVLNEDGTAQSEINGRTQDGLSWTQDGETVTLFSLTTEVFRLIYDGETLTLKWGEDDSAIDMILERVDAD